MAMNLTRLIQKADGEGLTAEEMDEYTELREEGFSHRGAMQEIRQYAAFELAS